MRHYPQYFRRRPFFHVEDCFRLQNIVEKISRPSFTTRTTCSSLMRKSGQWKLTTFFTCNMSSLSAHPRLLRLTIYVIRAEGEHQDQVTACNPRGRTTAERDEDHPACAVVGGVCGTTEDSRQRARVKLYQCVRWYQLVWLSPHSGMTCCIMFWRRFFPLPCTFAKKARICF